MSLLTRKIFESSAQLFTLATLRGLLSLNRSHAIYKVVKRLLESKVLIKIERNKYGLKNYSCSKFSIANFIYEPSYVSFESALNHHGILSQFPYQITSATLGQTRLKKFDDQEYGYYHLKKSLYWGYVKIDNYLIADCEKAILDQLYLASKGIKKIHLEEYDFSLINKSKLKTYIAKFPKTNQFNKIVANLSKII